MNVPEASKVELFFARLFGKRQEARYGDTTVIGYHWRGRLYITDVVHSVPWSDVQLHERHKRHC
jgi:hypothetical protein